MEEKKITEKESLDIITRMIEQTKQESSIGSGNMFLVWGYLCTIMSLGVYAFARFYNGSNWGWLYLGIPVLGFVICYVMALISRKKKSTPNTYSGKSINGVWQCISFMFAVYAIYCFIGGKTPVVWNGMFLLGMILPGMGTYSTGVILKEHALQLCGFIGMIGGLMLLGQVFSGNPFIDLNLCLKMAITMIITLVIPGHILNYKAKKARKQ